MTTDNAAYVCSICRFPIQVDDAIENTVTPSGKAICTACYQRETDGKTPAEAMPKWYRDHLESVLREASGT